jgi:hypothetical protein
LKDRALVTPKRATTLRLGWKEDRNYRWPSIPSERFAKEGRYREALQLLEPFLRSPLMEKAYKLHWDRVVSNGSTLPAKTFEQARQRFISEIPWMLVYEAEWARIWDEGPRDWRSTLREYHAHAKKDSVRLKAAIQELRRFDVHHAYLLRHAFWYALNDFLSDATLKRARKPNQNRDKGYEIVEISGPRVREREFQFASRLSFFRFAELLEHWETQIDRLFEPWPANWKEFGALRFEQAVSPREAAKFNIVRLGLTAHLLSRLRDFTAGYGIRPYSTGQPIPTHGRPCWDIVAEFLNAALSPNQIRTGDSVRRTWQSFNKRHAVTMQSWPNPAIPESQTV